MEHFFLEFEELPDDKTDEKPPFGTDVLTVNMLVLKRESNNVSFLWF